MFVSLLLPGTLPHAACFDRLPIGAKREWLTDKHIHHVPRGSPIFVGASFPGMCAVTPLKHCEKF